MGDHAVVFEFRKVFAVWFVLPKAYGASPLKSYGTPKQVTRRITHSNDHRFKLDMAHRKLW